MRHRMGRWGLRVRHGMAAPIAVPGVRRVNANPPTTPDVVRMLECGTRAITPTSTRSDMSVRLSFPHAVPPGNRRSRATGPPDNLRTKGAADEPDVIGAVGWQGVVAVAQLVGHASSCPEGGQDAAGRRIDSPG